MKVKTILVSQPAPPVLDRSPFYEIIAKHGLTMDFHPFIKVERVSVKEFRQQRVEILAHSAVIFTNRSSVDHFFQICEETRTTVPETMKYFCVTEAIALYLQKYIVYRKRKIFFGKGTFTDLMEQVVKHREEHFLLPLPDSHKPEITRTLDKLKIKYDKVILSHTVSTDIDGLDLTKYDLLVFYSPSEIATLVNRCGRETTSEGKLPLIATFGNGTAVATVEAGLKVSVLAPTPEFPSMVKALDTFLTRYNAGETVEEVKVEKKTADISHLKPETRGTRKTASKTKTAASKGKTASKTATGKNAGGKSAVSKTVSISVPAGNRVSASKKMTGKSKESA